MLKIAPRHRIDFSPGEVLATINAAQFVIAIGCFRICRHGIRHASAITTGALIVLVRIDGSNCVIVFTR